MKIPEGTTHINLQNGNFYKLEEDSFCYSEWDQNAGYWILLDVGDSSLFKGLLIPIVEWEVSRKGAVSHETVSDGSTATYYELPKNASQLQHLISHRDMNAQIGEIFRACYRYGIASHSDKLRDAKKIKFYIEAEIERLEGLK